MTADARHEAAIACDKPHQVVLAPPGTGKTHLSVRLAGHLAPALPQHSRVLLLTFSRQARAQLEREAAKQLTAEVRARIEITNYHRLFWQGVRAYRRALGLPDRLDIGSRERRERALRAASPEAADIVAGWPGLIETLAEHAFPEFHDHRTPEPDDLAVLLAAVENEHREGRLVFDDLGALFWQLLETQPTVAAAYADRFPVVIADEHQDASALQDAVARRLGRDRRVVLGDTAQVIHEYRGASRDRFLAHVNECGDEATHRLVTRHRWNAVNRKGGDWLWEVRRAIFDERVSGGRPHDFRIRQYPAGQRRMGAAQQTVYEVREAFKRELRSIAVLVRRRDDIAPIQNHLLRARLFPRRIGSRDFSDARRDIEALRGMTTARARTLALNRLTQFVPTFDKKLHTQIRSKLGPRTMDRSRESARATPYLDAIEPLYEHGASAYVHVMADLLRLAELDAFYCPRPQLARAFRHAAARIERGCEIDEILAIFADEVTRAEMVPLRTDRGLFLMTAHQAKGKEFDSVIITPFNARGWPDTDEGRRLFYVALTRATHRWCVITPSGEASPLLRILP